VWPVVAVALAWPTRGLSLLLIGGYGVLWWRTLRHARRRGLGPADARLYAKHMVIGKFAEAQGLITFWRSRLLGRRTRPADRVQVHGRDQVPRNRPAAQSR
jgi:hypothetical protein